MHAGVGAIHDVDVPAVIDVHVIRLNRHLAALIRTGAHAALVRLVCNGGDIIGNLLRMEGVANIESAHAGIEMRDKNNPPIVDRREIFIARMRAKPPAAVAEIAAALGDGPRGYAERIPFIGDV